MKTFISIALLVVLAGCGMSDKLDVIRDRINVGDDTQVSILGQVSRTGDISDKVRGLTDDVRGLTQKGMHAQTLGVALQGMFSPENTQQSSAQSPPMAMIPFAQTFAQEATEDEAVQIFDLLRHEALDTGTGIVPRTQAIVALFGLGFIAGQIPLDRFMNILATHVDNKGSYEETCYFAGEARYLFLRDGLFTPITQQAKIQNLGTLRAAVGHFRSMKRLARLTYSKKFAIVIPAMFVNNVFNPGEVTTLGAQAQAQFKTMLDPDVYNSPEAQALLAELTF
jgi:hypothetical protein